MLLLVDCLTLSVCIVSAPVVAYLYISKFYIEPAIDAAKGYVEQSIVRWTPQAILDFSARVVPNRWRALWTHLSWFSVECAVGVGCVIYLKGLDKRLYCDGGERD